MNKKQAFEFWDNMLRENPNVQFTQTYRVIMDKFGVSRDDAYKWWCGYEDKAVRAGILSTRYYSSED